MAERVTEIHPVYLTEWTAQLESIAMGLKTLDMTKLGTLHVGSAAYTTGASLTSAYNAMTGDLESTHRTRVKDTSHGLSEAVHAVAQIFTDGEHLSMTYAQFVKASTPS